MNVNPTCCDRIIKALFFFGLFGVYGVLVDVDHAIFLVAKGIPVTLENLSWYSSRFLHGPILLADWLIVIVLGALLFGLLKE